MTNLSKVDGSFFDADYYERGRESGKGWLQNYRWMPQRSFREALAIIDMLHLDNKSHVLDVGCAKGFIVRALRELEINADGCDISEYALKFAPTGCWKSDEDQAWKNRNYTHAFSKDVFEHNTPEQLKELLGLILKVAPILFCIVPLGDKGKYRIPEYHAEITHFIIENEDWWMNMFQECGWEVVMRSHRIKGLKDNWAHYPRGNGFFILRRKGDA